MRIPTFAELEDTFTHLCATRQAGVPGVLCLDSGNPGRHVAITACTHGNEPSGLAAIWHYLNDGDLRTRLSQGRVTFVVNNLEAARRFFAHPEFKALRSRPTSEATAFVSATWLEDNFGQFRSVDVNMNRLPRDWQARVREVYEFQRVEQLLPVFAQFDAALDVHSTTKEMEPVVIPVKGSWEAAGLPVQTVIDGIVPVQIGLPVAWYYGLPDAIGPMVVVETGTHTKPASFEMAINCAEAFLRATGAVENVGTDHAPGTDTDVEVNTVIARIEVPSAAYQLSRVFNPWDIVRVGEVIAEGPGEPVLCPSAGRVLFPPAGRTMSDQRTREEVMFICAPPRTVRVRTSAP